MSNQTEKTDLALYLFHQGTNFTAYRYLGCHAELLDGVWQYTFRTWAPGARRVAVVGDFCDWTNGIQMERISEGGVWECRYSSENPLEGAAYKFKVTSQGGVHLKGDPYAVWSHGGADGASVICHPSRFAWQDAAWLENRKRTVCVKNGTYLAAPLNIYEVHLASFMRHENGSYLSYRELADTLVPYVKAMGYTHVELLPIAEYPYDPSWGYQVCAFYAPTSRFGNPDDFRYFVNAMHSSGVGVILDWVPAHFPKDEWGLYEFDGGPLYEYQGKDRQESRSWGTRFFDLGRNEVRAFLISNAAYWLTEFHVDGLRTDAVSSMLYLDYDREPGEWFPNIYGENKNLEAISFLRALNAHVFGLHPDVLMIAEESTSWGGVTHPSYEGGLGFNLKWNMGWANDLFDYIAKDPIYRRYHHTALNFPLMYAYNENYILPISHDEVVYGKKTLIDKPFGTYEQKFLQFKTTVLLQMTYPGKKMMFMGTEYGQFAEWNYAKSLEWFMLDYPAHFRLRQFVAALNRFYLDNPALWELDFKPEGFHWLLPDEADDNMVAFERYAMDGTALTVLLSFNPNTVRKRIPALPKAIYEYAFETDPTVEHPKRLAAVSEQIQVPVPPTPAKKTARKKQAAPAQDACAYETREVWHLDVDIPPFSGLILRRCEDPNTLSF